MAIVRLAVAAAVLAIAGAAPPDAEPGRMTNARPRLLRRGLDRGLDPGPPRTAPNQTGACEIKPGLPVVYKKLCDLTLHNETECKAENLTCYWKMLPRLNYTCRESVGSASCVLASGGKYSLANCSSACTVPSACYLKPGLPVIYKKLCDLSQHNETACKAENLTCYWGHP